MVKHLAGALGLAAGAVMLIGIGGAAAQDRSVDDISHLDSSWEALSVSGTHEFYVNCTGRDDYLATADGADYKEAQMKAWEESKTRVGSNTCWPIWRGKVK